MKDAHCRHTENPNPTLTLTQSTLRRLPCIAGGGEWAQHSPGLRVHQGVFPPSTCSLVHPATQNRHCCGWQGQGPEFAADVEWNFVKFVVDRNGDVVKRLPSPFDRVELEAVIERLLAQN